MGVDLSGSQAVMSGTVQTNFVVKSVPRIWRIFEVNKTRGWKKYEKIWNNWVEDDWDEFLLMFFWRRFFGARF